MRRHVAAAGASALQRYAQPAEQSPPAMASKSHASRGTPLNEAQVRHPAPAMAGDSSNDIAATDPQQQQRQHHQSPAATVAVSHSGALNAAAGHQRRTKLAKRDDRHSALLSSQHTTLRLTVRAAPLDVAVSFMLCCVV